MKIEHNVYNFIRQTALLPEGSSVICGLSGGADSVALCYILSSLREQMHFTLFAAHVHHGIRGEEADRDEQFARSIAKKLQIPFYCVHYDVPVIAKLQGVGTEECARNLRYAYFAHLANCLDAGFIATAHNANDALETQIINLTRGAGIRGLASIPASRPLGEVTVVRPLLRTSRAEIESYLGKINVGYIQDSTNFSDLYTRNQIRHHVLPLLEQLNPSLVETSASALSILADDVDFIEQHAQIVYSQVVENNCIPVRKLTGLHPALQNRIIEMLYRNAAGDNAAQLQSVHIHAILRLCRTVTASAYYDLPSGMQAQREYAFLRICKKNASSKSQRDPLYFSDNEICFWNDWQIILTPIDQYPKEYKSIHNFFVDCSKIYGKLFIRSRIPGDSIHLAGHSTETKLKKIFIDRKIPKSMRDQIPVICDEQGIVAVAEIGVADRAALDDKTRKIFSIQIKRINGGTLYANR